MDSEVLIRNLNQFGLTKYEAKAYLALSLNGALTASEISEKSTIPQSKVYEIMRLLVSKSLAEQWLSKPIKYKSKDPVIALKSIIEQKKNTLDNLAEKTNTIINYLKPYKKEDTFGLWSSKGKRAYLEKIMEILERTEVKCYLTTENFPRYSFLDDALMKSSKKDIDLRILGVSELDQSKILRAKWYAKNGAKIRFLPLEFQPVFGVGDGKEFCIRIDIQNDSEFIWSNNPAMVNIIKTYFEGHWKNGRVFNYRLKRSG